MRKRHEYCDGISRRDFLRVGGAGVLGFNLALPALLRRQAAVRAAAPTAAAAVSPGAAADMSLILVFLQGGLSTIDTFDMKPDAPADVRGDFGSIPTNVPGIRVCDLLPRIAKHADKFAQIRSFTHRNASHGDADHYMLTGYHPAAGFNLNLKPNNQFPSHGSIISRKLGPRGGSVPPYVCLPSLHASAGSAYLGAAAAPFAIEADPNAPNFAVPDLAAPFTVDGHRAEARRELLARVDRYRGSAEAAANAGARTVDAFSQRAIDLMTSAAAKKAFDVSAESPELRDAYGRTTLGQSCLMARRLVEAGVRCVTVNHANWDTHYNNFAVLKKDLLPQFDAAMSTLFQDLSDRGMLGRTLVVVTGEFGRTPRVNKDAGRDHWSKCFTVCLGGGGIVGGRVIGKSDKHAEEPAESPYGPEDLAATMYHLLGIDPTEELTTPDGRPVAITNKGRVIKDLF